MERRHDDDAHDLCPTPRHDPRVLSPTWDETASSATTASSLHRRTSWWSSLYIEARRSVFPFSVPHLEDLYVEFAVPSDKTLQCLFLVGMFGVFLFQPLYVGSFTYDWMVMTIAGAVAACSGIFLWVAQRRRWCFLESKHAERAWMWANVCWCLGINATLERYILIDCLITFPSVFTQPTLETFTGRITQRIIAAKTWSEFGVAAAAFPMRFPTTTTSVNDSTGSTFLNATSTTSTAPSSPFLMPMNTTASLAQALWTSASLSRQENPFDLQILGRCHHMMLDPYFVVSNCLIGIGIVRLQWFPLFFLIDFVAMWCFRWLFFSVTAPGMSDFERSVRPSPIQVYPCDAVRVFVYFFYVVLLGARERGIRQRFRLRQSLLRKMEQSKLSKAAMEHVMENILPATVLSRLMMRESTLDTNNQVSVLFSDIVGFTAWSSSRSAVDTVQMLNCMYRRVDADLRLFDVDKITTIGDAYWASCGLFPESEASVANRSVTPATRLAAFGLQIQRHVEDMRGRTVTFSDVRVRVGIATGTATGGIVGYQQLSYQLFGPVNEAAEFLEEQAPAGGVLICSLTRHCIDLYLESIEFHASPAMAPQAVLGRTTFRPGPVPESFILERLGWTATMDAAVSNSAGVGNGHTVVSPQSSRRSSSSRGGGNLSRTLSLKRRFSLSSIVGTVDAAERATIARASQAEELIEIRHRLSTPKHAAFPMGILSLRFEDDHLEEMFGIFNDAILVARVNIGLAAMMDAVWLVLSVIVYASECFPTALTSNRVSPHSPFVFLMLGLLLVAAISAAIASPYLPPTVTWIRIGLQFTLQLLMVALFTHPSSVFLPRARSIPVENPSLLSGDVMYLMMYTVVAILCVGNPAAFLSWWWALVVLFCTTTLPAFIWWTAVAKEYNIQNMINILAGPGLAICISSYRFERDRRIQFVDTEVTKQADQQIQDQRFVLTTLLGRTIPKFIVPELMTWIHSPNRSDSVICHFIPYASIAFFRVPEIGNEMSDAAMDPEEAFGRANALCKLYDDCIEECNNDVSSAKAKHAHVVMMGVPEVLSERSVSAGRTGSVAAVSWEEPQRNAAAAPDSAYVDTRSARSSNGCRSNPRFSSSSWGLIKIKTIGDVALVASGLHRFTIVADDQAVKEAHRTVVTGVKESVPEYAVCEFVHMLYFARRLQLNVKDRCHTDLAAGVHLGPVVTGILGEDRLVYDVFGDTVNTASRIMTTSIGDASLGGAASSSDSPPVAGVWTSRSCVKILEPFGLVKGLDRDVEADLDQDDGDRYAEPAQEDQPASKVSAADNGGTGGDPNEPSHPCQPASLRRSFAVKAPAGTLGITLQVSSPQHREMKGKGRVPCYEVVDVFVRGQPLDDETYVGAPSE